MATKKYKSFAFLCLVIVMYAVIPLHAQNIKKQKIDTSFIQKGKWLSGFSVSFINASRSDYGRFLEREFTQILFQINALYFLNDRIGIGPKIDYRFNYRDLENPFKKEDTDLRTAQIKFGILAGYFLPFKNIFGGKSDNYLFLEGGVNLLRDQFKREDRKNIEENYLIGYEIGSGLLFPVGEQIAITTKLLFQLQNQQYPVPRLNENSQIIYISKKRWTKTLSLSVGLSVTF